jgi:hypothetical protein
MFSIDLLSRVDILSSVVGAAICVMFLYQEGVKKERKTIFPWEQAIGMVFTTSVCPLTMYLNYRFYEKWRNAIVILLRLSFMVGTYVALLLFSPCVCMLWLNRLLFCLCL